MSSDTVAENEGAIGTGHIARKTTVGSFIFQANHLILQETYSTEVITTTIDTNGRNSCAASRRDVLNPNQQFYQSTRPSDCAHIVSTDRRYQDVTCIISQ